MHLTFTRSAWVQAIRQLNAVLNKKNSMDILRMIYISAVPDDLTTVRLTATDLEIILSLDVPAEVHHPGGICLPGAELSKLLTTVTAETFVVTTDDRHYVTLTTETGAYVLSGLDGAEYPFLDTTDASPSFTLNGPVWAEALQQVLFAVSTDESRYALTGVYLDTTENEVCCVTTDGHRLAKSESVPYTGEQMSPCIFPAKACKALVPLLRQETQVTCSFSDARVQVHLPSGVLSARLIDAPFPAYQSVIPSGNLTEIAVSRDEYGQKLKQVLLASGDSRLVKHQFQDDVLTLSAVNSINNQEANETLALVTPVTEPITIGFNGNYVSDAVNIGTDPTCTIALSDALSPGKFTDPATPESVWVVMPMRV